MPIYEYQCESCGAHIEKLQKVSDPVLKECPACHKPSLKKMISASSFRLKGTGWYETDFKTGKKKHGTDDKTGGSENSSESTKAKADNAEANKGKASTEKSGSSDSKVKADSGKTKEPARSTTNSKSNGSTADSR